MSRVRRIWENMLTVWWSWNFQRYCSQVGTGTRILGPCSIFGGGNIRAGDHLVVRSRPYIRVQIFVTPGANLRLGNNVFINQGARISCSEEISIGNGCQIGDECVIIDNDYHQVGQTSAKCAPICLEDNVWLGLRVIVLRGVTIGEGSVMAAGSVVTRSVPPYSFAAGVPARVIRSLRRGRKLD